MRSIEPIFTFGEGSVLPLPHNFLTITYCQIGFSVGERVGSPSTRYLPAISFCQVDFKN